MGFVVAALHAAAASSFIEFIFMAITPCVSSRIVEGIEDRPRPAARATDVDGGTAKQTPAMAAGIANRVWSYTDIAGLLESN